MAERSATGEIRLQVSAEIKNTLDDGTVASLTIGKTVLSGQMQSGVEVNQINRAWEDLGRVIQSGNTEDLDFYDFAGIDIGAGAGNDGLGQPLTVEEIVVLIIHQTAGPGRLQIMPNVPGNGITWLPTLTVANGGALKTGGVFCLAMKDEDAFDIEDGVSHIARFGALGGAVTYDIHILARHDDEASSSSSSSSSSASTSSSSSTSSSCSSPSSSSSSS